MVNQMADDPALMESMIAQNPHLQQALQVNGNPIWLSSTVVCVISALLYLISFKRPGSCKWSRIGRTGASLPSLKQTKPNDCWEDHCLKPLSKIRSSLKSVHGECCWCMGTVDGPLFILWSLLTDLCYSGYERGRFQLRRQSCRSRTTISIFPIVLDSEWGGASLATTASIF